MFEEFLGIPAHPLIVHAAVVFVPLQVLAAITYAVVPFARRFAWWAALGLGVIAPLAAWAAKLSGQAFRARLIRNGRLSGELLAKVDQHNSFGNMTAYFSTGLGVLMLLLLFFLARRPATIASAWAATTSGVQARRTSPVFAVGAAVVTIGVALATAYYVFRTGDTGAHIVWQGQ